MKDTHPAVEEKFYQLMREKSGEERLKMGFEMYDFTRRLVIASLEKTSGTMDFFKALLDRFYGNDLPDPIKQRFLERLRVKIEEAHG